MFILHQGIGAWEDKRWSLVRFRAFSAAVHFFWYWSALIEMFDLP
jgi:hypothetical protein